MRFQKLLSRSESLDLTKEHLPEEIRLHYQLAEYNYAIRGIHFPEDKEVFYHARERLVFEEFLQFILAIRKLKDSNSRMDNEYDSIGFTDRGVSKSITI